MTATDLSRADSSVGSWLVEPFDDCSAEQFAGLRAALESIGFTETQISKRAGIVSIYDAAALAEGNPLLHDTDALAVAVRLLILNMPVTMDVMGSAFEPRLIEALSTAGLLMSGTPSAGSSGATVVATVSLFPVDGLLIAADRHSDLAPIATGIPADIVYSAMTDEAREFARLMPRSRCDDYLELCSGSGIAALIAARHFAARATGVDVAARSTRFATFNAALNGLSNTTMLTGDVYEPVSGRTFDVITAHPPYVPALTTTMVYRDGGEDGEGITRRIVEGVPAHLRPGGSFYGCCMMTDRKGHKIEARIREMLGPASPEFDVVVAERRDYDVVANMERNAAAGKTAPGDDAALRRRFEALEIERFVGVAFLLHRRAEPSRRAPITARRVASPRTTGDHLQWYLKWCVMLLEVENRPVRFLDARPRRVDGTELRSRSVLVNGRWSATHAALVSELPFVAEGECPPWFATLLSWCDGQVTARQHLARLREIDLVPPAITEADFGAIVQKLGDAGFVDLDICPLP